MSLSTHLFLLLLFLPFTFQLTVAQSNGNYLIEKVSGEDIVEGRQQTTAMLTKFRMLFGLLTCRSKHRSKQQLSPQPEPPDAAEEIPSPLAPPHQLPAHRKAPPPLQIHMPAVQGVSTARRKHMQMIVAISASVLATLAIFGAIKLLTRQQHKGRSAGSSNKVSFDPEPEIHYLDSLAPFIEIDSDHKLSSESKSVVSVDNILSPPLLNEELPIESILDVEGHSEDAAHCANSLSSDDNESFHSACCSHCSSELTPTAFEPNSPRCRLTTFFINSSAKKSTSSSNAIASNTPSSEIYIEPLPSSQFPRLEMSPASSWSSSKHSKSSNPQERPSELASADNMDSTKPLQTLKSIPGPPPQPLPSASRGSIPKPPPPPSFRKNTPLPPSQPWPQSPPTDKDGNPLPKLKPLHWEKVRAAPDRCMVWDKIRSRSFELDEKTIESLFGYNAQCSARNEESKIKNSSPGKQVLEHKRLQNFTILLKALNATAEQVCNSLILGSGLSTQQLETLANMVPTKEEEEKLYKYEGDIAELGSTEKFLKVILCIPSAFSRIEVMLYKATFGDEVTHLKKSFEMLEEACEELRSSRLFLRLLEAVLMTGNRMNIGTTRGGARAFKLDALLKLADIKGTDGKTTLLHFVVQEMIKSEGFNAYEKKNEKTLTKSKIANEREGCYNARGLELVSRLSSELCNVKKTASMDLDALGSSVSNLSNGISKLKEIVKEDELSSNGRDGGFLNSLRSFQKHGEGVIWELKDCEDRVFRHVREITEYYHGNVSKDEVNPLRIFVIVSDFLGMLDRVCKEIKISKAPQTLNLNVLPSRGSS